MNYSLIGRVELDSRGRSSYQELEPMLQYGRSGAWSTALNMKSHPHLPLGVCPNNQRHLKLQLPEAKLPLGDGIIPLVISEHWGSLHIPQDPDYLLSRVIRLHACKSSSRLHPIPITGILQNELFNAEVDFLIHLSLSRG
jgi:hypothetical protein